MEYWQNKRNELIGKLPTIMDVLDRLAYGEEKWALEKSPLRMLMPSYIQEGMFEIVEGPDGKGRLIPCSLSFNAYYRGESGYHKPCKPSLYRKGMTDELIFHERLKACELELLIEDYPITSIFKSGLQVNLSNGQVIPLHLKIDAEALAQHYGIKTDLLDLTVDKFVAAFFATTTYRCGKYYPIEPKEPSYGVIYMYSDNPFGIDDMYSKHMRAVGLQPFSRPGEQAGFVLRLGKDEDFRKKACRKIKFRQDKDMSWLIYNYTNRADKLFPESILQKKADAIINSKFYSVKAFNLCKARHFQDVNDRVLLGYLKKLHLMIKDFPPVRFSDSEKAQVQKEWDEKGLDEFRKKVIFRPVMEGE